MTDEEHCNTGTKSRRLFRSQERAELAGADRGHADDVRGEGVGVMQEHTAAEREGISRLQAVEP
jgi:hypothetical protein